MINISKSGNAIKFVFTDSDHYLYGNGEIEVPVNSLSLIVDESNMVTFRKANSNDIFLSFDPANSNLSDKAGVINFYKTEMVGSTGGGSESGITSGDVETMIDAALDDYYTDDEVDAALSGKASVSDVTAVANDVSTVSGQVATKVDASDFSVYSAATDARIAEDEEVTAAALNDLQENKADTSAVTAVNDALTAHTSNTGIHVSAQEKNAWNAKAEPYSAGTGIEISGNVISATGGGVLVINSEDLMNNMTDEKWDELANALENDIPIFSVIDASDEGITDIQQFPVNGMITIDENEGTTEITLNQLFGGGYYDIHIQKNGSEDYSVTGGGGGQSLVYYTEDTSNESATIMVQNDDGLGNRSEKRVFVDGGDIIIESYNETDDGKGNTGTTDTQVDINSLGLSIITSSDDGIDTNQTELEVQPMGAYINSEPIATEPYVDAALSGKADTSAVTAVANDVTVLSGAVDDAKAYYIDFTTLATVGIHDDDWDGIVAAIDDHRPIYAGYPRTDGGIIYYGVECMNKNSGNTEIIMTASDNSAHYFYTFTKNGSNDYSYTVSTKPYVPDITTSITSGSTDSEIPTAKAVYDAIPTGGGATYSAGTNISIDTANTINCTLPISSIQGYNGIIVGKASSGNGYRHIVGGLGCNVNEKPNSYIPDDCLVIGQYLNAHNTAEVAFGKNNITVQNTLVGGSSGTTAFSIGNGRQQTRHNAFEIRQNGDIYFPDTDNTTYQNDYEKPMVRLQDMYAALGGLKLVKLTQAEYDALVTKDANTLYIISNVVS